MSFAKKTSWIIYVCLSALVAGCAPVSADPLLTYPLKIRNHTIRVETAQTEEERARGLMFRDRLPENTGMVFLYPKKAPVAMWMKNTRIPLSVAFIDETGRILNIEDMTAFSEQAHSSNGSSAYALEMNLGWFSKRKIKAGDRIVGLKRLPPAK